MPTECELCHEDYEKADDEPDDICPACWEAHLREVDALTPAEVEDEAAYYAWLESQMKEAVVVVDPVNFVDDDQGYCGPTCGRFGNW